jgi:hypothetical protein
VVRLTSIEDVIRLLQAAQATSNKKAAKVEETRAAKATTKKPRKASAYSKRYGAAFKRLAPQYKKKDGSWKKDGFKRCAAAARKEAKK